MPGREKYAEREKHEIFETKTLNHYYCLVFESKITSDPTMSTDEIHITQFNLPRQVRIIIYHTNMRWNIYGNIYTQIVVDCHCVYSQWWAVNFFLFLSSISKKKDSVGMDRGRWMPLFVLRNVKHFLIER